MYSRCKPKRRRGVCVLNDFKKTRSHIGNRLYRPRWLWFGRNSVQVAIVAILALLAGSGCATKAVNDPVYDPLEPVNRGIYAFNSKLDSWLIKPAAKGYNAVTPAPVKSGITNFFNNLDDVNVIVNDVLQGKFRQAGSDLARFAINSTVGVLGFIDVGTRIGLPKHYETFGQTFGKWGIGEGPFVMLPLFGPSNLRAAVGRVPGSYTTYPRYIDDTATLVGTQGLEIVAFRAGLLASDELLGQAALDPYVFLRDFWSRRHRLQTADGNQQAPSGSQPSSTDELLDDLENEIDEIDQLDQLD